jgi:hypothetical protein
MEPTKLPSLDFIAGLISAEGSFLWSNQKGNEIPVFQLKIQGKEKILLDLIKMQLGLKEKVYEYRHQNRHYALLLVRKKSTIENILIPFFDERLLGTKKSQFEVWKNKYFEKKLNFIYKYTQ